MPSSETAECSFCKQDKVIRARGWCAACYGRYQKTGSPEYKRKGIRNICEVEDCDKFVVSHGLCDKHRKRLVRHGHLEPTRANDWGSREKHPLMGVWRSLVRFRDRQVCERWADFWLFVEDVKERPSPDHYMRPVDAGAEIGPDNWHWVETRSTTTESEKAYLKAWSREDRKRNPRKYKDKSLMKQYGIGIDEYESMQDCQDGVCAICSSPETALNPKTGSARELAVDHCHTSGKIRGLLCSSCNVSLGGFKDDVELLQKAIHYLKCSKVE